MNDDGATSGGQSDELVEDVFHVADNLRTTSSVFESMKRRRQAGWASLVIAAVGLGVIGVSWFLDDHRPGLATGQVYGLDVSHHQGAVDWHAVARDDIDFVYIKATEGGDWVDPRFSENWAAARAAGLDVSAYHFFTLCRSGPEQAANFLATVPTFEADLPLALDLEFAAPCSAPLSPDEVRAAVTDFVSVVEAATGVPMMLYVLPDFDAEYRITDAIDRQRWTRSLYRRPDEPWTVWQYSYRAQVDGVDGGVDLNVGALP